MKRLLYSYSVFIFLFIAHFTARGQSTVVIDSFYRNVNARMQLQKIQCDGNVFEFYRSSVNISQSRNTQQFLKEDLHRLSDSILLKGFLTEDSILVFGKKYPKGLKFSRVSCLAKRIVFYGTTFTSDIAFTNAILNNDSGILFANSNAALTFVQCSFYGKLTFEGLVFNKIVSFNYCLFKENIEVQNNVFNDAVKFNSCIIKKHLNTSGNVFKDLYFINDSLDVLLAERDSVIRTLYMRSNVINRMRLAGNYYCCNNVLSANQFVRTIAIISCTFTRELDLRKDNFSSVFRLCLYDFDYPIGALNIDWKLIFGREKPLITTVTNISHKEAQIQFKELYDKLYRNLKEQEEEDFYNDCKYEARLQQYLYEDNKPEQFYGALYDTFFGFGYKPLRFMMCIVLPGIAIASICFLVFRSIVVSIVSEDKHRNDDLNWISKTAHAVFFASWVLFSVRFDNSWFRKDQSIKERLFFISVVLVWILGIVMYIGFAVYVKNDNFTFIRGIFGF
jgi:hypothetical protein